MFSYSRSVRAWWLCVVLAGAIACGGGGAAQPAPGSGSAPASPVDPATAATVRGTVRLEGTAPPPSVIRLDGDPTCAQLNEGSERQTESLVVGEQNAIQNVFVYVKEGLEKVAFPAPTDPVVLDQQKCRYLPHVLGIQVGQPLTIRNSDPLLHNVRADGAINQPFNIGQPVQGISMTRVFATREVMVPVKCDVHAWMTAYIGVVEHPFYAVTDATGAFSFEGLPPGTYTIEAWHETLGTRTAQITVGARESKTVDVTFTLS